MGRKLGGVNRVLPTDGKEARRATEREARRGEAGEKKWTEEWQSLSLGSQLC